MNHWFTFLDQEMIQTLGWTFIHSLWQASIIAIVLLLVLRKIPSEKASLRYGLATFSLFSIFITSLCTFIILLESGQSTSVESVLTTAGTAQESLTQQSLLAGLKIQSETIQQYLPLIVSIWISGMILFAIRLASGALYLIFLRKKTSFVPDLVIRQTDVIRRKLSISKKIEVKESAWVGVPVVLGHLKPLILFPIGAVNQLSPGELEAILAHELAHVMRNDYLQNIIQTVIETIFYYHPAVWWISSVVRDERENCCDDLAVTLCGSSMGYAKALVRLQDMQKVRPVLAMPVFTTKKKLLNRVKRILHQPINKSNTMEKSTATFLCLICFLFLSMSATNHENPSNDFTHDELALADLDLEFQSELAINDLLILSDTIPPKSKVRITKRTDDQEIELIMENDKIQNLKIDGKVIPAARFGEYEEMIAQLREDLPVPPAPPAPPAPPVGALPAVPAPPAPPAAPQADMPFPAPVPPFPAIPPMPDMPPLPPMPPMQDMPEMKIRVAPHAPSGLFPRSHSRSIIKEEDEDGNIIIRIEEYGVSNDEDDAIIIEGNKVIIGGEEYEGDTVIVLDEKDSRFIGLNDGNLFVYPDGEGHDLWFDIARDGQKFRLLADTIHYDQIKMKEWNDQMGSYFEKNGSEWQEWNDQLKEQFENNNEWKEYSEKLKETFENGEWNEWREEFKKNFDAEGHYKDAMKLYGQQFHLKDGEWKENSKLNEKLERERYKKAFDQKENLFAERGELEDILKKHNIELHGDFPGNLSPDVEIFNLQNGQFNRIFGDEVERNPVIRKMLREGLITDENDYHVSLNGKRLKVNGKKMSDEVHQDYLRYYERQTGTKLEGNSRLEMRNQEKG